MCKMLTMKTSYLRLEEEMGDWEIERDRLHKRTILTRSLRDMYIVHKPCVLL